jgi:hypothetical protein
MKLSSLKRDPRTMSGDGVWITPMLGETARFRVLGATPQYKARRDTMVRRLTRQYGHWDKVPPEKKAEEQAKILFEELIRDVDGIEGPDGKPATLEEVKALASTPEGEPALDLAFAAVDMATARRDGDAEAAEGNSSSSSDTRTNSAS